ncbi:hypothetical protein LEP1GSC127_4888 [Leptospira kirschneri str. 200801925]|nr:hypothetical protein LEP1GSC127_4888 [Leptospira kirschneri str. 200801925]
MEEMDKFYSLCKTTLYADFIILLESRDPLSIKIAESEPKFNFSINQTNINLLSISYSENRPVLPYTLTRQEINFSNFDALEEIDFAQMIVVPIPNENIEDRRKNILLFLYSKNTESISEFLKLITELCPRIYEIFSIKNKEILLNSVHSRLDSILKTIPQPIIFMDSGTGKTWINESAAKLLSLSEGGEVSSWKVSTAMTELIQSAVNQKEIFLEMNRNLSNMNLEKFSAQWMFTDPEKKYSRLRVYFYPARRLREDYGFSKTSLLFIRNKKH